MIRVKLTKFEKIAGYFVGSVMAGTFAFAAVVAIQKGWFKARVPFHTVVTNASGLRRGCFVEMAGLRIGQVENVEFDRDNKVAVRFSVLDEFRDRIRGDSHIQVVRPYVVGDKILDVTPGSTEKPIAASGSLIASEELFSIIDVMNGRSLAPYVKTLEGISLELKDLADLLMQKTGQNPGPLVSKFTEMISNIDSLTRQLNHGSKVQAILDNTAALANELHEALPQLKASGPQMARDISSIVSNMALLTEQFKKVIPALAEVAPDLPHTAKRAVEALDETVVVLKAMQKSFLLRGSAKEVREEEAKKNSPPRVPASDQGNP